MHDLLVAVYFYLFRPVLTIAFFVLLAYAIMGWLFTFGILQSNNPVARQWWGVLHQIVDPVLRPVRRYIPNLGQFDLSFLVVILGILFVRDGLLPALINLVPLGDGGCDPRIYECVKRD